MTTTAEALALILQDNALGTTGENIFANYTPPTPDVLLGVFVSPMSVAPDMSFGDNVSLIDKIRVQVMARGARDDFDTPMANAVAARAALGAIANQTLHTVDFLRVAALDDVQPLPAGPDEDQRPRFACNFEVSTLPAQS